MGFPNKGLVELNARWQQTAHPHAIGEGQTYYWFCPSCHEQGKVPSSLGGAMSDSLAHKSHCPAIG